MEDITLTWDGTEYRIPHNKIMPVIAQVEDVITLGELVEAHDHNKIKFSRLSIAYATMLRAAGAEVTDHEVHEGLWSGNVHDNASNYILSLITLMIPPDSIAQAQGDDKAKKKTTPKKTATKKGSS